MCGPTYWYTKFTNTNAMPPHPAKKQLMDLCIMDCIYLTFLDKSKHNLNYMKDLHYQANMPHSKLDQCVIYI